MAKRKPAPPAAPARAAQTDALERFRPLLPAEEWPLLLAELARPLPQALRVNLLKASRADLGTWAARYGWETAPVPYCDSGWQVKTAQTAPSQTLEHRSGQYYIQDAASMLPVELFDFAGLDTPLVLDLAASPGGKTTHLVNKTGDRGLTLANDGSAARITALKLVLQTWGAANTAVTNLPGESFGVWFPETFDRVLLDAPCSMQGLRSSDSHPMRPISDRERDSLAARQARLLASALEALKTGGQAVYSTCTLSPEEDEGVLDALLRQYPHAVRVEDTALRLPQPAPALSGEGGRNFAPGVTGAARLWPHRYGTAGFFAALLTKTGPTPAPVLDPPRQPRGRADLEALPARAVKDLAGGLRDAYDFDLNAVLEEYHLSLWRRGREVRALPEAFLQRFSGLPVEMLGLALGEETPDGFIPAHEWVSRFAVDFTGSRLRLEPEQASAWLRGNDLRTELPGSPGSKSVVIVEDELGRFIGCGRALTGRLRNLLPRRLAQQAR